jgi:hypothetical protein
MLRASLVLLVAVTFTACGGSGGGGAQDAAPLPHDGHGGEAAPLDAAAVDGATDTHGQDDAAPDATPDADLPDADAPDAELPDADLGDAVADDATPGDAAGTCGTAADCPLEMACDGAAHTCTTTCSTSQPCHAGCCSAAGTCQPYPTANALCPPFPTLPVGSKPVGIVFDGTVVWIANEGSSDVYRFLASTGAWIDTQPLAAGLGAQYLAFDGAAVWVTNPPVGTVTKFDASTGTKINAYATDLGPDGVAFDQHGSIWVANWSSGTVTKHSVSTGAVLRSIDLGGNTTKPRFPAFDGTHIWVTLQGTNEVKKILVEADNTDAVVDTFALSGLPYAIVFDGTYMWITRGQANKVSKLASNGEVLGTYDTDVAPNGIAFDGTNIWTSNQVCGCVVGNPGCPSCPLGTVTKLRASDGAVRGTYEVGERPQWVAWDGQHVWVTNGSDNTVSRF